MYLKKAFRSFGQLLFLVALDKPTPSLVSSQIWKKKKSAKYCFSSKKVPYVLR